MVLCLACEKRFAEVSGLCNECYTEWENYSHSTVDPFMPKILHPYFGERGRFSNIGDWAQYHLNAEQRKDGKIDQGQFEENCRTISKAIAEREQKRRDRQAERERQEKIRASRMPANIFGD